MSGNKKKSSISSDKSFTNKFNLDKFSNKLSLNQLSKTKEIVTQAVLQARKSLKIFEKETFAKAKNLVKIPSSDERRKMTNDRILSSLRKLGVATHSEIQALEQKLHKLESHLPSSRK